MPKGEPPLIYVVDDDEDHGAALARLLVREGFSARSFEAAAPMLHAHAERPADCIVTDVVMAEADGFELAERLRGWSPSTAILFMTAWPTAAHAVDSVRRLGGIDYLEKPVDQERLLSSVAEGVAWSHYRRAVETRLSLMTHREREVFELLVKGMSNKAVAATLGISPKTVEDHRAAIMAKTGATNLAQLITLAETR